MADVVKIVFPSRKQTSLCHSVTVTFPTLVTPSCLAKLNGHVQSPLWTTPQLYWKFSWTLITKFILEKLVWTLSSSSNLLWITRRPSCSCWPKYFFHVCTFYRHSFSHIWTRLLLITLAISLCPLWYWRSYGRWWSTPQTLLSVSPRS